MADSMRLTNVICYHLPYEGKYIVYYTKDENNVDVALTVDSEYNLCVTPIRGLVQPNQKWIGTNMMLWVDPKTGKQKKLFCCDVVRVRDRFQGKLLMKDKPGPKDEKLIVTEDRNKVNTFVGRWPWRVCWQKSKESTKNVFALSKVVSDEDVWQSSWNYFKSK